MRMWGSWLGGVGGGGGSLVTFPSSTTTTEGGGGSLTPRPVSCFYLNTVQFSCLRAAFSEAVNTRTRVHKDRKSKRKGKGS